jgi:hypothetical protein
MGLKLGFEAGNVMKHMIWVAVVVAGLVLGACSGAAEPGEATTSTIEAPPSTLSPEPRTKVLFVGDSLTSYRGGLKTQVPLLAASAVPPLNVDADDSTNDGATLEDHWNIRPTPDKIAGGDYDIVVLQGDIPGSDVETFKENARNLIEATRQSGAEPVLYMAWPYERKGWITMDEIAQANADIATELNVRVAPVGLAFERALSERPELNMLAKDNEHQSTHGVHLVAYVIYRTLFGTEPPDDVTDLVEGDPITEEDARFLHRIARETVDEYAASQTP